MVVVLIAAAGAGWESAALSRLAASSDVVVLKRCVDVDDLLATAAAGEADAAVVGLDAPGLDLLAIEHLRRAGVRPVAVAPLGSSLEAARVRATRIGVRTVLAEEEVDDLPTVLADAEAPARLEPDPIPQPEWAQNPSASGRVIAVWGPAGAPGRTTVATGLAAEVARRGQRTILVDADPYGGSVAQVLGILDEVSGMLAAARLAGSGQLAERFASVQRRVDPFLTVVSGLPRPDRWIEVRPGSVELILETAAEHGQVIVDTGFSLEDDSGDFGARPGRNQMTLGALSVADEIVVVGTADPVGLSRLARALVELRETAGSVPARVVVNRMRPSLGWAERDVADMVAGFARPLGLHFLPEDRTTVDRALVTGRTVAETSPDAMLVRGLAELAQAVLPGTGAVVPGQRWSGRLRRRTAG